MAFNPDRYDKMVYRRCGRSGMMLPAISLGMWHNFGGHVNHRGCVDMMRTAFDLGITHFDLANNYGPPPGSAETRVGRILREEFAGHRDELIISSKAGYRMWPGPYGDWGSRKYLIASLDQSLKRLGLDYVDIFYSHRPDPDTPLEETLGALEQAVRQGKALYAGISSYSGARYVESVSITGTRGWAPVTIHQPLYNLFTRGVERDLLQHTSLHGTGIIAFCPLAQGLLTNKYLDPDNPIPEQSRAADADGFLRPEQITEAAVAKVRQLNVIAELRGQSMAQMALSWVLRDERVTSALIGARNCDQIRECVAALDKLEFTPSELAQIDAIVP